MENKDKDQKKADRIQTVQKVGETIEKAALKSDEALGNAKAKMGDTGKKLTVGAALLLVLAVVKDSSLLWIGAAVFAVLFLPQLVEIYKKYSAKKEEKQPESTEKK